MLSNANSELPGSSRLSSSSSKPCRRRCIKVTSGAAVASDGADDAAWFLAASRLTQEDGGGGEPYLEPISPPDMSRIGAWSQTLKERREAASLSRHKARGAVGNSGRALEALESGTYAPSQMSLLHLLSVPELDLETQSLPWEASASDPNLASTAGSRRGLIRSR